MRACACAPVSLLMSGVSFVCDWGHLPIGSGITWALMRSAVRRVHWMRPGMELDSIRLAVLMVSPKSVYLDEREPDL